MGNRSIWLAGLAAVSVLVGTGCSSSDSKESNAGSSTQPQQTPNRPVENPGPSAPQPVSPQPSGPSGGYATPVSTSLVKALQFDASATTLLTGTEKAALESEFLECGVSDSLVPACQGSGFLVSSAIISTYGGSNHTQLSGKVGRYKDTGKTFYLFRIETPAQAGIPRTSTVQVYVASNSSTTRLNDLADQAETKLSALAAAERIAKLEETLAVKRVASPQEWSFANEAEFAAAYGTQAKPRAFYHWTSVGLSNRFRSSHISQYFMGHLAEQLSAANADYKTLFVDLGLNVASLWNGNEPVAAAFRSEYSASSDTSLRGKLAISILSLEPTQEAATEHLIAAKDFLLATSESFWIRRGVSLFTKYGSVFGPSTDLVRLGNYQDYSIRQEVAKALANYTDDVANQWILRLTADSVSYVRDAALATIQGRNYTFGSFDVSALINTNDYSSRVGLAKGLRYARGSEVNKALLRLNADTVSYVRDAALSSIDGRALTVADFDISLLINTNDYSSRVGLAKALKYSKEQNGNEALLRLNADTVSYVRDAALDSIDGRNCDLGAFEVSDLINTNDYSSRVGLAKALKHVVGQEANEALLRLNADTVSYVRDAALSSINGRNYDFGNFGVPSLINTNDYSSRVGLAKALKFAQGAKANEALLRLNADTVSYVRDAALDSIQARPFDAGTLAISNLINTNDYSSRVGLAKALRYVTGQPSINALITLVLDSVSYVRDAAKDSLHAHGLGG